jgi:hypothetical protein
MTVFLWYKNNTDANEINIFNSYSSADGAQFWQFKRAGGFVYSTAYSRDSGYTASRSSGNNPGPTVFAPVMFTINTSVLRIYLSTADVSGANDPHSMYSTLYAHDNYYLGGGLNGDVAELAVWNTQLGDTEWASLKAGALPETVSPGSLVDHWSLQTLSGGGTYTGVNGRVLTESGTVVQGGTHPITRADPIVLSGTAVLAGMTADGGFMSVPSSLTSEAILAGILAGGGMGLAPGVLTTPVLKNNTGTILASVTGIVANVYHPSTGVLVVRQTGLTSDGSGIVTISDVLLAAGTSYVYELDLSASTQGRRLPTGVAA